jgi:DNA-binding winged helix-turn-helix (wHTH) protein
MAAREKPRVRFGLFQLDLHCGELSKGELKLKLQGQPIELLSALLERPGELVTREELRQRLWPSDTFVDFEHSLNTAVRKLRQALGDEADTPRYIETLPKRGYRFIGEIQPLLVVGSCVRRVIAAWPMSVGAEFDCHLGNFDLDPRQRRQDYPDLPGVGQHCEPAIAKLDFRLLHLAPRHHLPQACHLGLHPSRLPRAEALLQFGQPGRRIRRHRIRAYRHHCRRGTLKAGMFGQRDFSQSCHLAELSPLLDNGRGGLASQLVQPLQAAVLVIAIKAQGQHPSCKPIPCLIRRLHRPLPCLIPLGRGAPNSVSTQQGIREEWGIGSV